MKKALALSLLFVLMAAQYASAEPAPALQARAAVEEALRREADRANDPWTRYLLSQNLIDFVCADNEDLTYVEARFSVPGWDPGAGSLNGDALTWLETICDNVRASRIEGRVSLTLAGDGGVTLGDGLSGFVKGVTAAAKSAEAAFDLVNVRRALAVRLLPGAPHYGEDGAPEAAFAALCAAYADRFTPGELQFALSLVKNATLGVAQGPGALSLAFYVTDGDALANKAYQATLDALKVLDKSNAFTFDQLERSYAEFAAAEAKPFIEGAAKGAKQTMTVDFGRILTGDLTNDDFARYVEETTATFNENLSALAEEVRELPDYPRREQPESSLIGGPDAGTKLFFKAADDGFGRYVWLVDGEGGLVLTLFLRSGGTVICHAPEGAYTVYSAKGVDWFGEVQLFGDRGEYSRSAAPVEVLDETHYHTITLGAVEGNTPMDLVDFTEIGPGV